MAKCPGQDTQFWTPDAIYEVDCPNCNAKVEFWKDDVFRRCAKCGHKFRNPKLNLGCAEWCQYAKYCIGKDVEQMKKEKNLPCAIDPSFGPQGEARSPANAGGQPAPTRDAGGDRKEDNMEATIQTLDLRPMPPFERHQKIFESWETLKSGQTLEIVNDHDPKPLRYQFEAEYPATFEWTYKQKGPKDWVVQIKKTKSDGDADRKGQVKEILRKLHCGQDIKDDAKQLLRQINPLELATIEQELIQEGVSRDDIRGGLCDAHLEIMAETLKSEQLTPPEGHPIQTMMAEHKVILGYLNELESLIRKFKSRDNLKGLEKEMPRLKEIAHNLSEAEKHHQREEEVIFPMLEKYGIKEPPEIMRLEHTDLRQRKHKLHELSLNVANSDYKKFMQELEEAGNYLVTELAKHIFKEDNILYQAALKTFKPEDWTEIKKRCDRIGYCCFTPALKELSAGQAPYKKKEK